jgi:hypothetical protein
MIKYVMHNFAIHSQSYFALLNCSMSALLLSDIYETINFG